MMLFRRISTCTILFSALVITAPAHAQLDEIVVTAQKREQSLQEVPISISALAGDQFELFDITRADDLEYVFANVGTNRNSSGNTGISIRGVGTDNVHLSGQQSVGTYIDDVSTVSPFVSAIGVYDIKRVEVLRGPQNTLYGRNTTGGAVVWHTNKADPGSGTNGYGRLRAGSGGLVRFEGALGFDMGDTFAARIAVLTDDFDGVWKNMVDGSATGGAYSRSGARLNLTWNVSEKASFGFSYSTGELDGQDLPVKMSGNLLATGLADPDFTNRRADSLIAADNNWVNVTPGDVAAQPWLQSQYDQSTGVVIDNPQGGSHSLLVNYSTPLGWTYEDAEDGYTAKWDGIRLNFDYSFENLDFASVTSYDETYVLERNGQELTGFRPAREGDWEVIQQEFRLMSTTDGAVQWLAGIYLTSSDSTEDTWVANVSGAGGMGVRPGIDINSKYDAFSVYGQLDWSVTDALTLSAGLRQTDDELSAAGDNWVRTVCGFFPSAVGSLAQNRDYRAEGCPGAIRLTGNTDSPVQELSELGGKVGADYKFGEASMVFGSVSKGFKGGSYDNRALSTGDDPIGPEYLTAYEIGYKGSFANNTLQLTASTFFYDWEGMQLFESYGGIPALVNLPGVEITGLEVELKWAPNDRVYIQASVGTANSEVVDTTDLNPLSLAEVGKEVTNVPDVTANLMGTYSIPVGDSSLDLSLNYRYQSSMYYTFLQNSARDESSDYSYLNARAAYAFGADQQYNVALWGNNLTEEFACSSVIWGPGAGPTSNFSCEVAAYGEAMWGVTFEASFGGN